MKIIFAGTPEFAKTALDRLVEEHFDVIAVYTAPDKPAGRGRHLHMSAVKTFATSHSIPIYQPTTLRDSIEQQKLRDLNPDIMVVAAYGLLLPKPVLSIPKYGCINIHASLLPRWRGAAPIQRAIMAGDEITGITIMQMDEGLDTGDILLQTPYQMDNDETSETLFNRLAQIGAQALFDALKTIEKNNAHPTPQKPELSCYATKISKAEALIDWGNSAAQLDRNIRAFNPWPVAYSYLDNELIRIWKATPIDNCQDMHMLPGTIVGTTQDAIQVLTGEGVLSLTELQFAGGKRLAVNAILHAKPEKFAVGKRWGKSDGYIPLAIGNAIF